MMASSDILINIIGEFQKKGFNDANRAIDRLEKGAKSLGRTLGVSLSAAAITAYSKKAISAANADIKSQRLLAVSLNNVNLAYSQIEVEQFIQRLQTQTGILDDELRPAFAQLAQITGSVKRSQDLLALAFDVSAGSGKDINSVVDLLTKAFLGNIKGLKSLNLAYTDAELKAMDFNEVVSILTQQYAGQGAASIEGFEGKMRLLNVAAANATETIGVSLITALETLSADNSIENATKKMEGFGDAIANNITATAYLIRELGKIPGAGVLGNIFGFIEDRISFFSPSNAANLLKQIKGFQGMGNISVSASSQDKQKSIIRDMAKAEAESAKRAKEILALTRKQVKAQEALTKKKKEEGILGEIAKRFDLERIQVATALSGQINDVERLRLELMQAILDEDVKRAIILEGQLIQAEAAAKELAFLLDSLDEMVGDPFADWPATITRIQELLKQLKIKVPIETLFAEKGLRLDQEKMTVTKLERMDVNANNVYINGKIPTTTTTTTNSDWQFDRNDPEENLKMALAVQSNADALLAESEAALALLEAEAAAREAANAANDAILAGLFAKLGLDAEGNPIAANTTVNVTVEGSVISEGDLVEMITDDIYRIQKTGKRITLSSLSI
jgi:predicted nucleic acid-binding protein